MDFRSGTKRKLSKNILEMKFMKRSKEKAEKEKEDEDRQIMFSHEITPGMKESKYVLEPSYVPCEDLIIGRLSFHGFNPAVELIMKAQAEEEEARARLEKEAAERKAEKDISDEDMAWQYGALSGTLARKFKKAVGAQDDLNGPKRRKEKDTKYTWKKGEESAEDINNGKSHISVK
ncbi:M-phase phosphoprotein 6 [Ischnura elegans]|uniref:M-phase phosphoprotein 6 n=1 Tax=Ischnura elegans TaxID=197161 RepID=UPI001ED87FB5|nr:M-phase phosphoprotein 6 [Ischnura elegans]